MNDIPIQRADTVRRVIPSERPELWGVVGSTYTVADVKEGGRSIQIAPGGGFADASAFELVQRAAKGTTPPECVHTFHAVYERGHVPGSPGAPTLAECVKCGFRPSAKPTAMEEVKIDPEVFADFPAGPPLRFTYTNWKGETSRRQVQPIKVEFKSTQWHPRPQWMLVGWDIEKDALRDFAISDIVPGCFGELAPRVIEALRANAWTGAPTPPTAPLYFVDGTPYTVDTIREALAALDRETKGARALIGDTHRSTEGGAGTAAMEEAIRLGRRVLQERGLEANRHRPGEVVTIGHADPASPFGWIKEIFHGFTPSVDPDEVDPAKVFPKPLTVQTSSFATFIVEDGDSVACLTGDDHHERALAFVRGVQGGRDD